MAKIVIPGTNPVKYVDYELDVTNDSIKLDDRYNFDDLPASFEAKSTYTQKWKPGDPIRQQIWSKGVNYIFIQIVSCDGTVLATINRSAGSLLGFLVNGEAWDINQFDIDTTTLPEGEFYFLFHYGQDMNVLQKQISERQEITADMDDSVLFKYSHSYNDYNTIFKTPYNSYFNQTFYFRVEGRAFDKKEEGMFTEFDDQRLNKTLLSAKPFDTWAFKIGGRRGVPEWAGTVLNFIRSCDTVFVDNYQVSFFEKWEKTDEKNYRQFIYNIRFAKAKTEYAKEITICEPVTAANFTLPDATVNQQYYFTTILSGDGPFTIQSFTKPDWMVIKIIDNVLYVTSGSLLPYHLIPGTTTANISVTITNKCGSITLTDTIDIFDEVTCVPVAFTGNDIIQNPVYGQAWAAFIGLTGTAPFTLSEVNKPSWLSLVATDNGIQMTGTPNVVGPFGMSFKINNCSGSQIAYSRDFDTNTNVIITGNAPLTNYDNSRQGQIYASPGSIVTVTIYAIGMIYSSETFSLTMQLTGATLSVPLVAINGTVIATFIMPASGFVSWSAHYSGTTNNGEGRITVY